MDNPWEKKMKKSVIFHWIFLFSLDIISIEAINPL